MLPRGFVSSSSLLHFRVPSSIISAKHLVALTLVTFTFIILPSSKLDFWSIYHKTKTIRNTFLSFCFGNKNCCVCIKIWPVWWPLILLSLQLIQINNTMKWGKKDLSHPWCKKQMLSYFSPCFLTELNGLHSAVMLKEK